MGFKEITKKLHNLLVSWNELDKNIKEQNIDNIKSIPKLMKIVRS
jgi:hypothetical protein